MQGEAQLFLSSLVIRALEGLVPEQGEFWFIANDAGLITSQSSQAADSWYTETLRTVSTHPLHQLPLWQLSRSWLARGEMLDVAGLAWFGLDGRHRDTRLLRFLWGFPEPTIGRTALEQLEAVDADHRQVLQRSSHRVYQVLGQSLEGLQEMIYLGAARAPGLAVLDLSVVPDDSAVLMFMLETLLVRRFWVLLFVEHEEIVGGGQMTMEQTRFQSLAADIRALRLPGVHCRLLGPRLERQEGRFSFFRKDRQSLPQAEAWLLSPGPLPVGLEDSLYTDLTCLFRDGLGWRDEEGKSIGIEQERIYGEPKALASVPTLSPLPAGIMVEEAQERDVSAVIRLWEQLMDEHARHDAHFRRKPSARLHLHRTIRSQLNQPDYLVLVVRCEGHIVGFLTAQVVRAALFQVSRVGQIVDVFFLPDWRGKGLGSHAVEHAFAWFRQQFVRQVDLNVASHNQEGRSFWMKHGFRPYLSVLSRSL